MDITDTLFGPLPSQFSPLGFRRLAQRADIAAFAADPGLLDHDCILLALPEQETEAEYQADIAAAAPLFAKVASGEFSGIVSVRCSLAAFSVWAPQLNLWAEDGALSEAIVVCPKELLNEKTFKSYTALTALYPKIRLYIDMEQIGPIELERSLMLSRILLAFENPQDPFAPDHDKRKQAWQKTLLWASPRASIAFNAEAFHFLEPHLIPRLLKPCGCNPKTFLIIDHLDAQLQQTAALPAVATQ